MPLRYRPPKAMSLALCAAGATVKAHQTATAGGSVRTVDGWYVTLISFVVVAAVCATAAVVGRRWIWMVRLAGLLWGLAWMTRGVLIWTTFGSRFLSTCGEHVALGIFGMLWLTRVELWRVDPRVKARQGGEGEDSP